MDLRNIRLLHEPLLHAAEQHPEGIALVCEQRGFTFREVADAAMEMAAGLLARGLVRGDRVAIYLENGSAAVISLYATLLAGGVFMLINPQTKAEKLTYLLNDSEAAFLVSTAQLQQHYAAALSCCPLLRCVVLTGEPGAMAGNLPPPFVTLDALRQRSAGAVHGGAIPNDLAALIYTSGSTGRPKGVMMTHEAMLFASTSIAEYLRLSERDRIINLLPLAFDYGLYQVLMSVRRGATLILEKTFTYAAQVIALVNAQQATVFPGVPTVFATLRELHRRSPLCLPTVKCVTNTAANLPPDYHHVLREIFPNALIFRMYGLTECKRVSYLEPELLDLKPTSVGKAIPGTEVLLLSPDGARVPPHTPGILHVRGPHVMLGYWKQPELSAQMLKPGLLPGERMLCTQDWFTMDEDGYLYFQGRSDDVIKTRGEKVSPVEVENALHAIPGVRTAAVIGVPDELLGQAIKAFIVLEQGAALTAAEIRGACAARLEEFMVPRLVEFRDALETTATGKTTKKGLS